MEAEWQSAQYLIKLLLLRPLRCLLQSIVFLLVKTETYFIKADARALPSEGEIVVLMGIQSY
jgi:hypothetical protein